MLENSSSDFAHFDYGKVALVSAEKLQHLRSFPAVHSFESLLGNEEKDWASDLRASLKPGWAEKWGSISISLMEKSGMVQIQGRLRLEQKRMRSR